MSVSLLAGSAIHAEIEKLTSPLAEPQEVDFSKISEFVDALLHDPQAIEAINSLEISFGEFFADHDCDLGISDFYRSVENVLRALNGQERGVREILIIVFDSHNALDLIEEEKGRAYASRSLRDIAAIENIDRVAREIIAVGKSLLGVA